MTASPSVTVGSWSSSGTDSFGVAWTTTGMTGFEDVAPARLDFPALAGADGAADQQGFKGPRVVTFTGRAIAPDRATREAAKRRLRAAAGNLSDGVDVTVHLVDADYLVHGKQTPNSPWQLAPFGPLGFQFQASLTCADPLIYSATAKSASASLIDQSSTAGFNFPATFPLGFGGSVGAGQMVMTNNGTEPTWPTFRIDGDHTLDTTNALFSDQASGSYLKITRISAGQFVVIDTRNRDVLLMGYQSRRDLLASGSEWFAVPPGLDVVSFTADTFTAATASASWRDAY